jgi:hypothetical protein
VVGSLLGTVPLALVVVLAGALLVLTVAPQVSHAPLPDMSKGDFSPPYAKALGGNDTLLVDEYEVAAELPGFVGHPAYDGEQLLMWWPEKQFHDLVEPVGIFHAGFDSVTGTFPRLDRDAWGKIEHRRPGQVLLISITGDGFSRAVQSLALFWPSVARRGVLSAGGYHVHVWLVDLRRYQPKLPRATTD